MESATIRNKVIKKDKHTPPDSKPKAFVQAHRHGKRVKTLNKRPPGKFELKFDPEERKNFLAGIPFAKQKRKQMAKQRAEDQKKEEIRRARSERKKIDSERMKKFKDILSEHEKLLDDLRQVKKETTKSTMVNENDEEIEVTMTLLNQPK